LNKPVRDALSALGSVSGLFLGAACLLSAECFAQAAPPDSGAAQSALEDDDIDTNLVPLEPELSVAPAELPATGDQPHAVGESVAPASANRVAEPDPHGDESTTAAVESITTYNIPVVIDPIVEKHISFFNTSIRSRFEQWLFRLSRYRPLIENIFSEFDLPSDLVNLSLVESGFNPYAYSRAKATGPWQFMKATGKLYGLRIDHYVDERRDPIKSTVAAARYLRDLYDLFGTWPLAMAAYNAGEGKVMRALQRAQAETFWDISKTKLIRRETKQYVPRIMAATVIARNPDRYGFSQDPVPVHQFEEVVVTRPLHFRAIANVTGIPYEELRLLNPELRRDATPPDDSPYHLKVPVGTGDKVVQLLERVPTYKFPPLHTRSYQVKNGSARWYRVRVGDTLEKVSKRFRIPLKTLKARNNLSSHLIKPGEFLIITR
jgi:membrane-bound lytic murein transglycosylase D